eukprot:197168-Amphidinium_carterae.1
MKVTNHRHNLYCHSLCRALRAKTTSTGKTRIRRSPLIQVPCDGLMRRLQTIVLSIITIFTSAGLAS